MIHIIRYGELLPNYVNFESSFLQKLSENRSSFEVTLDILHVKYFDNTWKVTSKQIVVSDNIVVT